MLHILAVLLPLVVNGGNGSYSVSTRALVLPEAGTVTNWLLHTPKTTYAFMPPLGWKFEPSPGEFKLVWVSRQSARLTIRPAPKDLSTSMLTNLTALRETLTNRFPEATLRQTSACHTESEKGTVLDLTWTGPRQEPMLTRLAVVEVADTIFEFTLDVPSRSFPQTIPAFQGLLTSFQAEPRGGAP